MCWRGRVRGTPISSRRVPEPPFPALSRRGFSDPQSYEHYPEAYAEYFGDHGSDLRSLDWVTRNNGGGKKEGNNAGLIRFRWLREGLARLLADRRYWGFQLCHFVQGKVNASVQAHADSGLRLELTLAVMIGIANSFGGGGMRKLFLQPALAANPATPADADGSLMRELCIARHMMRAYANRDLENPRYARATQQLYEFGIDGKAGPLPSAGSLGHRSSRVLTLLKLFPSEQAREFAALGHFRLEPASLFPEDPTTA
jgi:hypothetical protein